MASRLTGDWAKAEQRLKKMEELLKDNVAGALKFSANDLERKMKSKIRKGDVGFEPLSPLTIARKGHAKPLRDSSSLMEAIKAHRFNRFKWGIGIPKGAKNKWGVELDLIAKVQEFGKIIRAKFAKYLAIPLTMEAMRLQHVFNGANNIPGLFKLKGRNVLAMKDGKALKILFVLKDKVTIPARSFVRSTWNKEKRAVENRIKVAAEWAVMGRRY